ncbi:unnamed protein product, partial [Urochloa humidicola]
PPPQKRQAHDHRLLYHHHRLPLAPHLHDSHRHRRGSLRGHRHYWCRGGGMGNCQAAEAAAVVIQHPGGKVERLYWATTAAEVMKNNPGHYVALVILRVAADKPAATTGDAAPAAGAGGGGGGGGGAKITRVKLLKPKDTLMLGQVYRLITAQEVTKALRARKNEKMQRCEAIRQQHEQLRRGGDGADHGSSDQEKDRHRGRGRNWRPALQSISEAASQSGSCSSVSEAAAS